MQTRRKEAHFYAVGHQAVAENFAAHDKREARSGDPSIDAFSIVGPLVARLIAYFSDRGRLFQSDRGR